ncbi:hypothetical protein BT93_L2014 [Corymbia citriodora subsp. variegata]|uniref:NB-ARC domain-containing protein n=1 Tax=Corymbia citriodora subsp. variegata TaxID=360336 RepID=A0A8T0CXG8_CORYI|nr:hypothetical protein BT93_L2014 [Corymbia citriodora subsp. variegata]
MDFAKPLSDLVKYLCGLASTLLGYIYNLRDNVRLLDEANENLKAESEDVKAKMEREEEETRARRTNQVANWLGKVQEFVDGADHVLQEAGERDRIKCLSRCLPRNCWSSYKLGKRVNQLLNEARRFQREKGEFKDFTLRLPPPQVLEMPMDKTVGLDVPLDRVWKWLVDEKQIRVIGLYGKGGVGKTTLMKRINEKLLHANHGFEIVIWVVVSRQMNEDSIRDAIRKRLHIQDESWDRWSQDERVNHLCYVLNRKKFVLLVDDVWARLDLSKIGVPHPCLENGSKVVFTTRSKQVCHQMEADITYEVECLMPEEALTLFKKNVGKWLENCHQEIQDLAKDIAEECKGLPLALITVGQAMASREHPHEWHYALKTLGNKPHELSGMEEVYHILEFSYNSINDSTIQLCFLYCCLFPEDYPIRKNDLIEHWIGEGLLGDTDDVYSMRDRGEYFLGSLKMACLLESVHDNYGELGDQFVKMHDVVRDMATWIARDRGQRENKLLVIEKEEELSAKIISKWEEAKKVSLWGKYIRNINQAPPRCSQLETLFVRETDVRFVPRGFFDSMTALLTVLDLSGNRNIELFPEGICDLINLRYLNLSDTKISELPKEIKNLTRLRWFLLNNISNPVTIPTGAIASLPLNVFSMWGLNLEKEEEMVEELGHMQDLTDLSISVYKSSSALKIFESFQRCIRRVRIYKCEDLTCIPISHSLKGSGNFSHLKMFHLTDCSMDVKMEITQGIGRDPNSSCFPSLIEVWVVNCGLLDLSWLVHAPKLQRLMVWRCHVMEKIMGDGIAREELAASGLFSRLESLMIFNNSKLRSICDHTLFFPPRVEFIIEGCPSLKKLPLDSNSTRVSFQIIGDKDWWAEFEWDPVTRVTFLRFDNEDLSGEEKMTFGEAARKLKVEDFDRAQIEFLPRNEAAGE